MGNPWDRFDDTRDQGRVTIHRAWVKKIRHDGHTQRIDGHGFAATANAKIEHLQPAGFTSNPGSGEKVEALFLDGIGDATHRVAIMIPGDRKKGLLVPEGHAALYAPADKNQNVRTTPDGVFINAPGKKVVVEAADTVVVNAATKVVINCGQTQIKGNVQIDGNLNVDGSLTHGGGPCCCCP